MPTESPENPSNTQLTWLANASSTVIVVMLLGLVAYREYYRYYFPLQIDPVSQWLFVANRTWSLIACFLLAFVALVIEWRRYRANGKSSLFSSFPGLALLGAIATLLIYTVYGT